MIGIICALDIEAEGLKHQMDNPSIYNIAQITYSKGHINGGETVVAECGVGKVNASMCTQIMIDQFRPEWIINSGIAGALADNLTIGSMVIASDVVQHDMDTSALGDPLGTIWFNNDKQIYIAADTAIAAALKVACAMLENTEIFTGRIATGDSFIDDRLKRKKLYQRFNALACDMEGGAIGQVCYRNRIPFGILRSISDSMNENEASDYFKFKETAAQKSIDVITYLLSTSLARFVNDQ